MSRYRILIRFKKLGNLCFIGHNDLLRLLERLFRRARVPLARTEGFHPKPKMSFPSALALGFAGDDEVMEIECTELVAPTELLRRLAAVSVTGLQFTRAAPVVESSRKAQVHTSVYQWNVPEPHRTSLATRLSELLAAPSWKVAKKNGKEVDVRQAIQSVTFEPDTGHFSVELLSTDGPEAGVPEVLTALHLKQELFRSIFPTRSRVVLR